MQIIPSVFTGLNKEGDFNFMIKSGNYERTLFLFNDNTEEHFTNRKGGGNAIIRPFNRYSNGKIYSAGIITGNRFNGGGFKTLNHDAKFHIDSCFLEIENLLRTGNYDNIYYSAELDGLIGTSIFVVSRDVREYITTKIWLFI
jgi:hypothetical protein